jgi:DNA-binding MarR family transcriptional regulator
MSKSISEQLDGVVGEPLSGGGTVQDVGPAPSDRAELALLMRRFGDRMRQRFLSVVVEFGLTPPLYIALKHLDDPAPMRDLADRLSCDASYVTGIADRLEALGLVARRPDPSDRRVKQLALTTKGRTVRAAVDERIEVSEDFFPELTDDEVCALVSVYNKLLGD